MTKMTKKARIERAREIIDRNELGIPFNDQDLLDFSAITGCELRYARRCIDPNYLTNYRHIEVLAYDWEEPRGWSWRKAIQIGQQDIESHERARITQAMRDAVRLQVSDFLESADKSCEVCATTDSLTVDHVWPPFSKIMDGYINEFGKPEVVENNGSGFKFANKFEEFCWQDFHQSKAKLAILCRSCNSKKGARPA
jgi:5-methylcytosine-specific restriction endonuclease McrA